MAPPCRTARSIRPILGSSHRYCCFYLAFHTGWDQAQTMSRRPLHRHPLNIGQSNALASQSPQDPDCDLDNRKKEKGSEGMTTSVVLSPGSSGKLGIMLRVSQEPTLFAKLKQTRWICESCRSLSGGHVGTLRQHLLNMNALHPSEPVRL